MYFLEKKNENFEGALNIVLGCSASCEFSCFDFRDLEAKLLDHMEKYANCTLGKKQKIVPCFLNRK